jgi:hypothetical protein
MGIHFVQIACDVDCVWNKTPPRYRVYVNDELFTERTWIWKDLYLEECLQISAPAGTYKIQYNLVEPELGQLTAKNFKIIQGPGRIVNENYLEITE